MSQFLSHSPAETEDFGFRLAQQLKGGEVIAMYGGMGMGKTAFTRGLARGLGIEYGISSPTFALVHEYTGRLTVYHFDMFRVESWDDLYSTGFYDYLDGANIYKKLCQRIALKFKLRVARMKMNGYLP